MGIIAHRQLKKTGLSETTIGVKRRIDQLEKENVQLTKLVEDKNEKIDEMNKEIRKLKTSVKKLEKENEKLKNPPIWMNDGEL